MKTKINPASITLELDGLSHVLPLDKAKEVVTALQKKICAIEGEPQTTLSKDTLKTLPNCLKDYENNWKKANSYPPYPPASPYFRPDKKPNFSLIWLYTEIP
jgi:hypothetical protein